MPENSKKPRIVVLNTRAANVHSVEKALRKVGAVPIVTSDPSELASADAAVLPGVGASDAVMTALNSLEMSAPVKEFAASGKPLLCVCVGLQVLFDSSEEGELPGLGLVDGNVQLIPSGMTDELGAAMKVPHMGWNEVTFAGAEADRNPMFKGIPQGSHFYFVHSYRCVPDEQAEIAATANYGVEICAAVARGNVVGTQFHPEKSGDVGLQIYKNFLDLASAQAK
ncbi:imidazole glycerol phosphate synthase subunit HisH [Candidatus Lucifugimonas marina]|jgi:glutamine amidotransferase|uniref:Imidazole glycerol phosphate synthase subunit HisH n=1 Tax=Candidatus Lucifugimonas marina TaxID=3038979 RepID=A0AAJ5ZHB7_9CHLR|nr:imidazole glycerol phosphate synthase subunit HisH [SAR202 cluster bacterium JH702]MDG0870308.1 imidazole glycerol phosphate synthase subunit HisH [SAR202 cluster bacterium JH639]WFG36133.1 imidazole glycerol phosphate synthase subunit HisH [SAR202 cluster bacterium JH545]WFG40079.1 imidazole glycerol phosphate synthase subunit HisH [SAR202 cluster bacterium JH1073]